MTDLELIRECLSHIDAKNEETNYIVGSYIRVFRDKGRDSIRDVEFVFDAAGTLVDVQPVIGRY